MSMLTIEELEQLSCKDLEFTLVKSMQDRTLSWEYFQRFLKLGISIDSKIPQLNNPKKYISIIKTSLMWGLDEISLKLIESGVDLSEKCLLNYAIGGSSIQVIDKLLELGVNLYDINDDASYGYKTALYKAASMGKVDVFNFLIDRGASVKNTGNETILGAAVSGHNIDIIKYIISIDPDSVNRSTSYGEKSIHRASICSNEIIKILLDNGANINDQKNNGSRPIYEAIIYCKPENVKYIIECGASLEDMSYHGLTPLQCAAANGFIEPLKVILEAKVSLDVQDNNGNTALYYAAREVHESVYRENPVACVKALLEAGACKFIKNNDGYTPWDSTSKEFRELVSELNPMYKL